jgi:hypothetical protein
MKKAFLVWLLIYASIAHGAGPMIWSGEGRAKSLTANGLELSDYTTLNFDGFPNYIKNFGAEVKTTGWSTYADAAGATPVNGTGVSPNVVLTRDTATKLNGNASFKLAKDAANRQGEGVSYDFKVPEGFRSNNSQVTFLFKTSANFVSGDMRVYLYDVDTLTLITPRPNPTTLTPDIPAATTAGTYATTWVLDTTASDDFRLILHIATTNANAYDIYFDDVVVSGGQLVQGAAVSGRTAYTPTIYGIAAGYSTEFYYRRVGSEIIIDGVIVIGAGGVDGNIRFTLPTGLTKVSAYTDNIGGHAVARVDAGSTIGYFRDADSDQSFRMFSTGVTSATITPDDWQVDKPTASWDADDYIMVKGFRTKITEWEDSVYLGSGSDNSVSALNWTSWTPTGYWNSNVSYTGKYRRVGDSAEFQINIINTGGAVPGPDGSTLTVNLPSGLVIDTTKMVSSGLPDLALGFASFRETGVNTWDGRVCFDYGSTTKVRLDYIITSAANASFTPANRGAPFTFDTIGDQIDLRFSVPIVGWTWSDYAGKITAGFMTAKVGTPGLVNNDSSNVTGNPVKAAVDGSTIPSAGYVGYRVSASLGNVTHSGSGNTVNLGTITLNKGNWLIFGKIRTSPPGTAHSYSLLTISTTSATPDTSNGQCDLSSDSTLYRHLSFAAFKTIAADSTPVYLTWTEGFTGTAPVSSGGDGHFYAIQQP